MGFIHGSLVWQAIHILLESILRHLLLRNDHLCKSFEMVPWLCMSSHRPCAATRGSKLDGETFLTPVSLRLWIRWWRNPPVKWNWWIWKCISKSSLVRCWPVLILWLLEVLIAAHCVMPVGRMTWQYITPPLDHVTVSQSIQSIPMIYRKWCEIHHQYIPFFLLAPKTGCFQTHSEVSHHWSQWVAEGVR